MLRFVALLALAGCGRISFATTDLATGDGGLTDGARDSTLDPDALVGHDEDNDGVPDSVDVCPHIGGTQADTDSDGVGDDCDPDLGTGADKIALFATMAPGDQPFTINNTDPEAVFTQLADSLRFDGPLGADQNLFGNMLMPMALGDVRVVLGIDIFAIVPGSASGQNQIALAVWDQPPSYFVELNQIPALFDLAAITHFDGTNYTETNSQNLNAGMHTGDVFFETTQRVDTGVKFEVGWLPDEFYTAQVTDNVYQGAARIELNFNNVHFEIRYLLVITPQ